MNEKIKAVDNINKKLIINTYDKIRLSLLLYFCGYLNEIEGRNFILKKDKDKDIY